MLIRVQVARGGASDMHSSNDMNEFSALRALF
jgi:hypothetical protein